MKTLQVQVNRRTATFLGNYPKEALDALTSFTPDGVFFMPQYNRFHRVIKIVDGERREVLERVWDGKIRLLKDGTLPLGLFRSIRPELVQQGYPIKVLNQVKLSPVYLNRSLLPKDFRYSQRDAFEAMAKNLNCGGLILACTGSGKTMLSGGFFRAAKNHEGLFVVDTLDLLDQAQKELESVLGEKVGVVGEGIFAPERITVATTQTLDMRSKSPDFQRWFTKLRFVFVDEIHVQMSRRTFKILDNVPGAAFFGLTATLQMKKASVRLKAQAIAGPVLYTYPLEQGIKDRILTPVVVVRVRIKNEVYPKDGYTDQYKQFISHNRYRNDVTEKLSRLAVKQGMKVIVLVDRVKHIRFLKKRMDDLSPQLVWGGRKKTERVEAKDRFEAGKDNLIITNKVFKKGVNIKSVDCGVNAAALKSKDDALQMLGRFVRKSEGKEFSVYFDLADYSGKKIWNEKTKKYINSNRFQKNAVSRRRAFQLRQVPILEIHDFDPETVDGKWFESILKKAKKAADSWLFSLLRKENNED